MGFGNFLPLFVLLAYGLAFASVALGVSLIGFDDHPGQLYRVWHVLTRGIAPWAWNPGWWMGYPELQFYPPGFAYAVAFVHLTSLGTLSVPGIYQAWVWLAYLAPGITVWLLLRRVLGDGWLALPGAFIALTLSAGLASGVEGGVHTGMVPARLAWSLLPLLALSLTVWMRGARSLPWSVVPLVAVVVLSHPAHLPAAVVLIALAAAFGVVPRPMAFGVALAALGLAAGITAFWTVPLLVHIEHTRALAWGTLSSGEILGHPLAVALVLLAALELLTRRRQREGMRTISAVLAVFPWVMSLVVLVDAFALEPVGIRWLPAHRVADSAWLAFVLSGGATLGRLLGAVPTDLWRVRAGLALAAVALIVVVAVPAQTLTLWPRRGGWERYHVIERGMRLGELWSTLSTTAGRILFVRSGVPLVYGSDWWRPHSHVTALTPLTARREIVNGTFTHPSPVAAVLYRGDAGREPIRQLVERLDGHRLFGRDLDDLDTKTFNEYADRFGIGAVVVLDEDLPRLRALRDNALFPRAQPSPPFVVYTRQGPVALPSEVADGRLRLPPEAGRDAWLSARIAYYPLWRAASEGRAIPTRRGPVGDLEVQPSRPGAPIDLVYARGRAETVGLAITALSLIAFGVLWGSRLRLTRSAPRAQGAPQTRRRRRYATSWTTPEADAFSPDLHQQESLPQKIRPSSAGFARAIRIWGEAGRPPSRALQ